MAFVHYTFDLTSHVVTYLFADNPRCLNLGETRLREQEAYGVSHFHVIRKLITFVKLPLLRCVGC